jgi:hypothetical protein
VGIEQRRPHPHGPSPSGVTWSDGTPFTSADVLFSLRAAYDEKSHSVIGTSLRVGNAPITATAPDANTVVFTYPASSGPGMRLLEMLPILPKHKLGRRSMRGRSRRRGTRRPRRRRSLGPGLLF